MPRHPLEHQLEKFINSLRGQGVLDNNFANVRNFQNDVQVLTTYCRNSDLQLERIEMEDVSNYPRMASLINALRETSSSIGGRRMVLACTQLLEFCRINNRDGAREARGKLRWEFNILRDSLQYIIQMESALLEEDRRNRR